MSNAAYFQGLVLSKVAELKNNAPDFFLVSLKTVHAWVSNPELIPVSAVERVFNFSKSFPPAETVLVEGKKVCITLPFYKITSPPTAFSVMGLIDRAKTKVMLRWGDAFIIHSRNVIAQDFLKTGIEWQLTIDDDMVVPWGNAPWYRAFTGFSIDDRFAGLNTVDRLLSHGKTLVGALYFSRWPGGKPVYSEGSDDKEEARLARRAPFDVCKPTRWVGTGCMMIHRSVYLDIEKKFPHLARHPDTGEDGNYFTPDGGDLRTAFREALCVLNDEKVTPEARVLKAQSLMEATERRIIRQGLGVGEDVSFCLRAADAGHTPHVDMGLLCGHIGSMVYGPKNTGK